MLSKASVRYTGGGGAEHSLCAVTGVAAVALSRALSRRPAGAAGSRARWSR